MVPYHTIKHRRRVIMKFEKDADRIGRAGRDAMGRLKRDKNWGDWLLVGEALVMGRTVAMNAAQTNRPEGRAYTEIFSQWLKMYKLDTIDQSARSKIFTVMQHRVEIEAWRATLTQLQRLELNHPVTVLRKWEKATKVKKPKAPKEPDQSESQEAYIAELEAAREVPKPTTLAAVREMYLGHLRHLPLSQRKAELEALGQEAFASVN
jgi:hypothetical protein